ncbi:SUMF1/EgtB/PvdO family nonheme iron enzyme [Sedimentisphaera salicampi]|nr:SUMF1/EgtB/PvdO family nonheme iron enzyme [Sedimentisphaera salicampi]
MEELKERFEVSEDSVFFLLWDIEDKFDFSFEFQKTVISPDNINESLKHYLNNFSELESILRSADIFGQAPNFAEKYKQEAAEELNSVISFSGGVLEIDALNNDQQPWNKNILDKLAGNSKEYEIELWDKENKSESFEKFCMLLEDYKKISISEIVDLDQVEDLGEKIDEKKRFAKENKSQLENPVTYRDKLSDLEKKLTSEKLKKYIEDEGYALISKNESIIEEVCNNWTEKGGNKLSELAKKLDNKVSTPEEWLSNQRNYGGFEDTPFNRFWKLCLNDYFPDNEKLSNIKKEDFEKRKGAVEDYKSALKSVSGEWTEIQRKVEQFELPSNYLYFWENHHESELEELTEKGSNDFEKLIDKLSNINQEHLSSAEDMQNFYEDMQNFYKEAKSLQADNLDFSEEPKDLDADFSKFDPNGINSEFKEENSSFSKLLTFCKKCGEFLDHSSKDFKKILNGGLEAEFFKDLEDRHKKYLYYRAWVSIGEGNESWPQEKDEKKIEDKAREIIYKFDIDKTMYSSVVRKRNQIYEEYQNNLELQKIRETLTGQIVKLKKIFSDVQFEGFDNFIIELKDVSGSSKDSSELKTLKNSLEKVTSQLSENRDDYHLEALAKDEFEESQIDLEGYRKLLEEVDVSDFKILEKDWRNSALKDIEKQLEICKNSEGSTGSLDETKGELKDLKEKVEGSLESYQSIKKNRSKIESLRKYEYDDKTIPKRITEIAEYLEEFQYLKLLNFDNGKVVFNPAQTPKNIREHYIPVNRVAKLEFEELEGEDWEELKDEESDLARGFFAEINENGSWPDYIRCKKDDSLIFKYIELDGGPAYVSISEITNSQYEKISGKEDSEDKPELPKTDVKFNDAQEFCKKIEADLPTVDQHEELGKHIYNEIKNLEGEAENPFPEVCNLINEQAGEKFEDASDLKEDLWKDKIIDSNTYNSFEVKEECFTTGGKGDKKPSSCEDRKPDRNGLYDVVGNAWEWAAGPSGEPYVCGFCLLTPRSVMEEKYSWSHKDEGKRIGFRAFINIPQN